jgi:hypothetical protein
MVKETFQNILKEATKGQHSPGHPVYGDFDPVTGTFIARGSLSHESGNEQNKGQPIGSQNGDTRPTYAYPYDKSITIAENNMGREISKSSEFLVILG